MTNCINRCKELLAHSLCLWFAMANRRVVRRLRMWDPATLKGLSADSALTRREEPDETPSEY